MSQENVELVRRPVAGVVCAAALVWSVMPTHAAFPGRNGRIAFVESPSGTIATVAQDGSGRRVLVRNTEGDQDYSSDGRRLVFTGAVSTDASRIEVVGADGRRRRQLTRVERREDRAPSWSPDGRSVVFWRQHPCAYYLEAECPPRVQRSRDHGILVYRRGRTRVLTNDGYEPDWSPDGTLIAFTRDRNVRGRFVHEVWVMRPDGSGQRRVVQRKNRNFQDLEWSPDSQEIVISTSTGSAIDAVRRDGSGYHRLVRNGENPAYSPDGEQIVFSRYGAGGCFLNALWVMRADGTRARTLRSPGGRPVCGDEPDWQPLPR